MSARSESLPRLAAGALFAVSVGLALVFNGTVTSPYMDEIFHVPQAQRYCRGDYTWDPMITTLPGLYMVSVAFLRLPLVSLVLGTADCPLGWLRAMNLLMGLGCLYPMQQILLTLHRTHTAQAKGTVLLTAVVLCAFPLHYFFLFLYYTDVGSTFFVLLMYHWGLRRKYAMSAGAGAVAIVFRQTNIIWVALTAGTCLLGLIDGHLRHGPATFQPGQDKGEGSFYGDASLPMLLGRALGAVQSRARLLLAALWPYALLAAGFAAFLIINDGIVVGDRTRHTAGLHLPQLGYFAVFAAAFAAPVLAHSVVTGAGSTKVGQLSGRLLAFTVLCGVYAVAVWRFTVVHPFILADNRHYTFYIWKRTLGRHWLLRYVAVPVYAFCTVVIGRMVSQSRGPLWALGYLVAVGLVLVPQQLIEPRYFILPYVVFRLHLPLQTQRVLLAEGLLYALVNTATVALFLARPFESRDWGAGYQRFMW